MNIQNHHQNTNYFNHKINQDKTHKKVTINWDLAKGREKLKIQNYILLDEIIFELKYLGIKYYQKKNIYLKVLNQYAEINTIIHHAIIEFENDNYNDSIELIHTASKVLRNYKAVEFIFSPLLQLLLTLNYFYKKESNQTEYYFNAFNNNINKLLIAEIEIDKQLINKITQLFQAGSDFQQKNPFLPTNLKGRDLDFIIKIIELIDSNLGNEELSVNLLSSQLYLSPSQVYRKINSLTNLTVVELIRRVKLDRAKLMLEENKANVSGVAHMIAYSASHFTRVFTKHYGLGPKEVLAGKKVS